MFNLFKNPVFVKDRILESREKHTQLEDILYSIRILAVVFAPIVIIGTVKNQKDSIPIMLILQLIYLSYIAVSNSCNKISSERENRTYRSLIGTLLSPGEIFLGKFILAYKPIFLQTFYFFPIILTLGMLSEIKFTSLILILILAELYILLITAFFTVIGIYCSTASKNSNESRQKSMAVLLFVIYVSLFLAFTYFSPMWRYHTTFEDPYLLLGNRIFLNTHISFPITNTFNPITNLLIISNLGLFKLSNFSVCCFISSWILGSFLFYLFLTGIISYKAIKKLGEVPE